MSSTSEFQVAGSNAHALFTLKLHRGDGMLLVAMNWRDDLPPGDFVGFAIEYKEPNGIRFFAVKNRLSFLTSDGVVEPSKRSTLTSPIQKFRWVHFPRNAELEGLFTYRVTPVFMSPLDELSYGEPQEAQIQLMRETFPDQLNVAFTRGYTSSQAFADRYLLDKTSMSTLLPAAAALGVTFKSTHPRSEEALKWMGFEARSVLLELLDKAIADSKVEVDVVAYDLCEPMIIDRLRQLKTRLRVIIDDDGDHGESKSGECQAEAILVGSAGRANVKRQHMGKLQHNKMIIVRSKDSSGLNVAVGGSTNFSWRGFYVQNNNALVVTGASAIQPFVQAFVNYWNVTKNKVPLFAVTPSSLLSKINLPGIDIQVTFSPHANKDAMLDRIAGDVLKTKSSLFFSLAFLYQTKGAMRDVFKAIGKKDKVFTCGISDKKVGDFDFLKPDGQMATVNPVALQKKDTPEPFKSEVTGGNGVRLHHKFIVIDFDTDDARVYLGSYNFSKAADVSNGENLFVIKNRRVAVSYMIEAIRIFDHYEFRLKQKDAKTARKKLALQKPPRKPGDIPWWSEDFTDKRKIKDRELFA
jgi:phosphatidylserine/phosphatidylglycerophosphate/cardiolipin synthase-like enzyme